MEKLRKSKTRRFWFYSCGPLCAKGVGAVRQDPSHQEQNFWPKLLSASLLT